MTTTSNRFEYLSDFTDDRIKDNDVADADTLDMQIQNIKLKRQVQLLPKRVAESTPNKSAGDCNDRRVSDTYPAKATITRCDLSATILFKLVDSYLITFKFAQ